VPAVTVIVRAKDKADTIERTLASVRRQTVPAELVVVDSGSHDATLSIASSWADSVIEIPPERFSYGYALNVGARSASAPIHVALSAHCELPRPDWIERCLQLYERADVAAVNGRLPQELGLQGSEPFYQTFSHAYAFPWWGFSNHASSWRCEVWRQHQFDENLDAAEDKEWAMRVMAAGWVIAFDAGLFVVGSHQWRDMREWCARQRKCAKAIASFSPHIHYGIPELMSEWWTVRPQDPAWRSRLNPTRTAGLLAKYCGYRDACRHMTGRPPDPRVASGHERIHTGAVERAKARRSN
jgi:rhamnosyltransferase